MATRSAIRTLGCVVTAYADGTVCNDGRAETIDDQCVLGACIGTIFVPECVADGDCSDGNLCNGLEQCSVDGTCGAGVAPTCEDPGPCGDASCDAVLGCIVTPHADGGTCDDSRSDTVDDQCVAGTCAGTIFVPECVVDGDCSDSNLCNGQEQCSAGGICVAGAALTCQDPGQCGDAICDATFGCVVTPYADGTVCNDGRAETIDDQCVLGACTGTIFVPECLVDGDCSDANLCTGQERCGSDGLCHAGTAPVCEDAGVCTDPVCDPLGGCISDSEGRWDRL